MSFFSGFDSLRNGIYNYQMNTNPITNPQTDFSSNIDLTPSGAGGLGNFDDEASWNNYLKVLQMSNDYNSAAMNTNFAFNEHMRDTQIASFMNQLKEQGINPILAVSNGVSLPGYGSGSTAQAYSGTSPYSNSSRVDAAIIRAVGSVIGDVINGVFGNSAATIRSSAQVSSAKIAANAKK